MHAGDQGPRPTPAIQRTGRATGRARRAGAGVVVAVLAVLAVGCSSDGGSDGATATTQGGSGKTTTTTLARLEVDRPDGPVADVSQELTGGRGPFMGEAAAAGATGASDGSEATATTAPMPDGYVQEEFLATGTATDYQAEGELAGDGEWTLTPGTEADYRTRVLVRRPEDPKDASGTTVVEWLNVSGGLDANPDWASLSEEIVRQGHTWVGVSAQRIGVEGGPTVVSVPGVGSEFAGKGLKAIDPERYGSLEHPGDGYSFDIFTQVARAVREGGEAFGGQEPEVVLAAGESQSAFALTTYYDGVQPLTKAFDGFLVHSRGAQPLPLVGPGAYADIAGAVTSGGAPTVFRGDVDAPVLELQSESDVAGLLGSSEARQPDTDTFRLWEVAGTAHADAHLLGPVADSLDCGVPINDGPLHVVAKAGLRHLDTWVRTGEAPPEADRLELTEGDEVAVVRDDDGIAQGGIRTAPVDVPVDVLSGAPGPTDSVICILLGSTTPLPDERIAELYDSAADYAEQYEADVEESIDAGFVLEEDRDALMGFAQPDRVTG